MVCSAVVMHGVVGAAYTTGQDGQELVIIVMVAMLRMGEIGGKGMVTAEEGSGWLVGLLCGAGLDLVFHTCLVCHGNMSGNSQSQSGGEESED